MKQDVERVRNRGQDKLTKKVEKNGRGKKVIFHLIYVIYSIFSFELFDCCYLDPFGPVAVVDSNEIHVISYCT